ncbi:CGNR zinc finger domain-containing protein [Jiangella mangrovi]|uniref:Putative RNA-binding Zn ribbon-like protein n=1 Tax=Jiangella mangrovi TaxID=1524084 RepID=A0A7W9GN50_9ACTN|nr:ABATE domain-containing protein [Jiangella mangrovi]MBB5786728.1 putative RNA-binding Zn ribbon-like protein [Jiangella mangrovi]
MHHAFPCGHLALDFAGTLRARRDDRPTEMLGTPADLDAWFREAGVTDGDAGSSGADLVEAVAVREAVYALVRARLLGDPYDDEALDLVNRAAAVPSAIPQLTAAGRRVEATPRQALSEVARAAVDVLSSNDAALLKECGRPECTQVYVDRSRGGRREWCAMQTCGNRMKAATYRARNHARNASPV